MKIKIDLPEEKVRTTLKLKKSSRKILNDYSEYYSDMHKKKISPDVLIDGILENLSKDKEFKNYCLKRSHELTQNK